jgi:hypothetical protein
LLSEPIEIYGSFRAHGTARKWEPITRSKKGKFYEVFPRNKESRNTLNTVDKIIHAKKRRRCIAHGVITCACSGIITSSDEKLAKVRNIPRIGPISTINYRTTPDWDIEVVRLNAGVGVDIIIENGGTPSLEGDN